MNRRRRYPAALGAWAATQSHLVSNDEFWKRYAHRPVIAVTGDGGFGQYPWEVTTAVKDNINLTHVLLRNDELGKISKEQRAGKWRVWKTTLVNPNVSEFVTSCGGQGIRVERADQLDAAIKAGLNFNGPATIEIMCDATLI